MISVYLLEGSDKTQAKTNDTMPHTCIYPHIGIEHTNRIYTRNRCCSIILLLLKTVRFSNKDCENTFYMSAL